MRKLRQVDARNALLERLPKAAIGAEIGVWKGEFSQRILNVAKPRELHLIDPWRLSLLPQHENAWYGKSKAPDMEAIYKSVGEKFADQVAGGVVKIHRGFSHEIWSKFADNYFDFAYIDGDHAFDSVRSDLTGAFAKVRQGGLICGDDYSLGGWWKDGVVRAVHEFVASHDVKIEYLNKSQFVIRKL